jgi:hypothetical protein
MFRLYSQYFPHGVQTTYTKTYKQNVIEPNTTVRFKTNITTSMLGFKVIENVRFKIVTPLLLPAEHNM